MKPLVRLHTPPPPPPLPPPPPATVTITLSVPQAEALMDLLNVSHCVSAGHLRGISGEANKYTKEKEKLLGDPLWSALKDVLRPAAHPNPRPAFFF